MDRVKRREHRSMVGRMKLIRKEECASGMQH
jgi:hypothetical protein